MGKRKKSNFAQMNLKNQINHTAKVAWKYLVGQSEVIPQLEKGGEYCNICLFKDIEHCSVSKENMSQKEMNTKYCIRAYLEYNKEQLVKFPYKETTYWDLYRDVFIKKRCSQCKKYSCNLDYGCPYLQKFGGCDICELYFEDNNRLAAQNSQWSYRKPLK